MKLKLQTPLVELHEYDIANLSQAMARKLAMAVAAFAYKNDLSEATAEDLLNYFPFRPSARQSESDSSGLRSASENNLKGLQR